MTIDEQHDRPEPPVSPGAESLSWRTLSIAEHGWMAFLDRHCNLAPDTSHTSNPEGEGGR